MGVALTIAKRDLAAYFVTPRGAAIFWVFLLLMGVFFNSFIYHYVDLQQRSPVMGGQAPSLEQLLRAFFGNLHFISILVVPAVTMASFADEKRSMTLRLLQTAPISPFTIVFGKFLAAVGLMTLVLMCSAVYPLYTVIYGNPDIGPILSAYLGLFLLMCSQIAFGIWISSMTKNLFMAFIFTLFGLFLLLVINWIAPHLGGGGLWEGVFRYLASTTHLDQMLRGLIQTSNVAYFVLGTALFLFFTNVVLDSQRWR